MKTVCLISSRGGHLYQLSLLRPLWKHYDHFWITERGADTDFLLKKERVYYGYFPVTRNAFNAVRNFFLAMKILIHERPFLLLSCGAGIAPPVFIAGRILGCKLIFIDSITFIQYPSLSARISSYFADRTLTQHKNIAKKNKRLAYWGSLI